MTEDYIVPNVLSPRDLVFRPKIMDETVTSSSSSKLYEPRHEKTNILVSDLVRHKPGYAVTEDG